MEDFCNKKWCQIRPFSRENREPEWTFFDWPWQAKVKFRSNAKTEPFHENRYEYFWKALTILGKVISKAFYESTSFGSKRWLIFNVVDHF